jgi:hypothetical protein
MSMIGKVSAVFSASTSGLTSGVSAASSSLRGLESSVSSLRGGMSALVAIQGAQLFGSLVSGAQQVARSFVSMGAAQAQVIDDQSKLAARLGMTYGEFAGLALAGDLAGVSMETMGSAITKADVAFVRAAEGSQTAIAAFEGLGLSVEQLQGMSAAERFDAIAAAIAALPTEAQRAEAAVQLFGRAGASLLPLFAGGAEGIAQARAEAERFGLTLTNLQGQNVEAMNDAFTRAQAAVNGVVQQVVAYLAPAIEAATTQFSNLVGEVGGANIGQAIGQALLQGAEFLAGIGDGLIAQFGSSFQYFSEVGAQWNAVWGFGQRVASFFLGIGDSLQASFGVLVGAITGPVQGLLTAAQTIGQALGLDTSGLDQALAGMEAFNATLGDGITENINSAADNFGAAFADEANAAGEAVAGPMQSAVQSWAQAARDAAAQMDVANRTTVGPAGGAAAQAAQAAVKGIESRSREGIELMFQLMRGEQGNSTQERIARAAEETAENTANMGIEVEEFDLAPAAGV